MNLDTIITELQRDFEIVDFSLPNGKSVKCVEQGIVLIPINKVIIYGMGQVEFPEKSELAQLKQERRSDQRTFNKNPEKRNRLQVLAAKESNQKKSQENLQALFKVGLSNSLEDVKKIISHLLGYGATIIVSTAGGRMVRSQMDAPQGPLTLQAGWKVLETGQKYLTTIHFIPLQKT